MIFLDKPFVSDLLVGIIIENGFSVYKNHTAEKIEKQYGFGFFYTDDNSKIYTVSENAIENVQAYDNDMCKLAFKQAMSVKDKYEFRSLCAKIYPDFFFKKVSVSRLSDIDLSNVKYPCIVKPSVGFLSIGVHLAKNVEELKNTIIGISEELETAKSQFPDCVVNDSSILLEQYIDGKEFAVDAYYDNNGNPYILNIFWHIFKNENDMSDRCYVTFKKLFEVYEKDITDFLSEINSVLCLKDFPFHVEFRYDALNNRIIPIEMNPLRFTGFCLNDIQYYISGKHPVESYMNETCIDMEEMWEGKENSAYVFSVLERPETCFGLVFDKVKFMNDFTEVFKMRPIEDTEFSVAATVFMKTNSLDLDNLVSRINNIDIKKYFI